MIFRRVFFWLGNICLTLSFPIENDILAERGSSPSPWTLLENFSGTTFFDGWSFFTDPDPTHGLVLYQGWDDAWNKGLVYIDHNSGNPIMKVDHWSNLNLNAPRPSIRITSANAYIPGTLFILDVAHVPTGCSVWPAWWFNGPNWPYGGEVDVMETVNGGGTNQMTIHSSGGCYLTSPGQFTGSVLGTNCDSTSGDNSGCGVMAAEGRTAGDAFNNDGGGVFVMQWLEDSISIWTFKRSSIPSDITYDVPDPDSWRWPDAKWVNEGCNIVSHFNNMHMIFDTTLCGDWANSAQAWGSSGCPGTCAQAVQVASNFREAYWSINSLKTFALGYPSNGPVEQSSPSILQPGGSATNPRYNQSNLPYGNMTSASTNEYISMGWVTNIIMSLWCLRVLLLL